MKPGPMQSRPDDSAAWTPCAEGTLQQMVRSAKSQRHAASLRSVAVTTAGLILLVAVGGLIARQLSAPLGPAGEGNFGGIACSDVGPLLPDYQAGRLEASVAEQVRLHLSQCPQCEQLHQKLLAESNRTARVDLPADRLTGGRHLFPPLLATH